MKRLMKRSITTDSIEAYAQCVCMLAACSCSCTYCVCACQQGNPAATDRDSAFSTVNTNLTNTDLQKIYTQAYRQF